MWALEIYCLSKDEVETSEITTGVQAQNSSSPFSTNDNVAHHEEPHINNTKKTANACPRQSVIYIFNTYSQADTGLYILSSYMFPRRYDLMTLVSLHHILPIQLQDNEYT